MARPQRFHGGRFVIHSVTDGQYSIRVIASGFSETEQRVTVAGQNVVLTISLSPATVSESVSVRAENYQERESSTGTRTDTPLIELPQAITVVNRQLLSDQAVVTLEEALKNVAGVKAGGYHRGWDYYRIRGFDSSFTTFIDGLRVDPGLGEEMFGLERVEVIKGPTSALYGQATSALLNRSEKKARRSREWMKSSPSLAASKNKKRCTSISLTPPRTALRSMRAAMTAHRR
jgi:iron complex outermembrane recepter protein